MRGPVSSPRHIERSVLIFSTPLSCPLHGKVYATKLVGNAFGSDYIARAYSAFHPPLQPSPCRISSDSGPADYRAFLSFAQSEAADRVLEFLIRGCTVVSTDPICSEVLVLSFGPALHATLREISLGFDMLPIEDVGQEILTAFLEICRLRSIQTSNGNISVTLYRTLRTTVFRWAFKQSREACDQEPLESIDDEALERLADANSELSRQLQDFLNDCWHIGALSDEDYELEGFTAKELSTLSGGLSTTAIHQRTHRIMGELRQRALR